MHFQPLFDRLLVEPVPEGSTTRGGLLIPDVAHNSRPYAFGTVLAVGTGRTNAEGLTVSCVVEEGDVIAYPRKAGTMVDIEDPNGDTISVVMMQERDVFAIVTGLSVQSMLSGPDGRLLSMTPSSRAMPDSAAKNREELELAEREGFGDGTVLDDPNGMTG